MPVLGPALASQDSDPEQEAAATVYTDLFIRYDDDDNDDSDDDDYVDGALIQSQ